MTEDKRQKIIDTIAKMSRLTEEGSNAFKGEISAASAKISELMEKYSISWMDINRYKADKQEEEFKEAFASKYSEFTHGSVKEWHWSLARLIAKVTMTRHYSSGGCMVFFGVKENAEIATELYKLWYENISRMATLETKKNIRELKAKYGRRKQFRKFVKENYPDDNTTYFRASWIRGCLSAMLENVLEEEGVRKEERNTAEKSGGQSVQSSALVLYKAEVDKAYAAMSGTFKSVKSSGSRGWSNTGYEKGKATGKQIRVGSKQIAK